MIIEYLNIAAGQTSDEMLSKIIKAHQAVGSNKPPEANTIDPVNYLTWPYLTNSVPRYLYQLMAAQTILVSPVCATIFPVTGWSSRTVTYKLTFIPAPTAQTVREPMASDRTRLSVIVGEIPEVVCIDFVTIPSLS